MTIECYVSKCPYHSCNDGDEGPFCFEDRCRATEQQIAQWFGVELKRPAPKRAVPRFENEPND